MRRAILVAAAVAVLAGCGSDEPQLGEASAGALHRDVAAVREAAGAGDRDGALEALDGLEARVRRRADAGELGDTDARRLLRGIERARARAESEVAEPQPTPEPTPEPTAEPAPEPESEEDDGEQDDAGGVAPAGGNGDGKGKAKGKAKGKGDD